MPPTSISYYMSTLPSSKQVRFTILIYIYAIYICQVHYDNMLNDTIACSADVVQLSKTHANKLLAITSCTMSAMTLHTLCTYMHKLARPHTAVYKHCSTCNFCMQCRVKTCMFPMEFYVQWNFILTAGGTFFPKIFRRFIFGITVGISLG